jgi:hypothetical protein
MDPTEGSETSANINQTLGIHPKVETVNTENSESLKSRIVTDSLLESSVSVVGVELSIIYIVCRLALKMETLPSLETSAYTVCHLIVQQTGYTLLKFFYVLTDMVECKNTFISGHECTVKTLSDNSHLHLIVIDQLDAAQTSLSAKVLRACNSYRHLVIRHSIHLGDSRFLRR